MIKKDLLGWRLVNRIWNQGSQWSQETNLERHLLFTKEKKLLKSQPQKLSICLTHVHTWWIFIYTHIQTFIYISSFYTWIFRHPGNRQSCTNVKLISCWSERGTNRGLACSSWDLRLDDKSDRSVRTWHELYELLVNKIYRAREREESTLSQQTISVWPCQAINKVRKFREKYLCVKANKHLGLGVLDSRWLVSSHEVSWYWKGSEGQGRDQGYRDNCGYYPNCRCLIAIVFEYEISLTASWGEYIVTTWWHCLKEEIETQEVGAN